MAIQTAGRLTKNGWYIFDGGTMAQGIPTGAGGHLGPNDGLSPGRGQAYWDSVYDEMKDMLNDALGG